MTLRKVVAKVVVTLAPHTSNAIDRLIDPIASREEKTGAQQ